MEKKLRWKILDWDYHKIDELNLGIGINKCSITYYRQAVFFGLPAIFRMKRKCYYKIYFIDRYKPTTFPIMDTLSVMIGSILSFSG